MRHTIESAEDLKSLSLSVGDVIETSVECTPAGQLRRWLYRQGFSISGALLESDTLAVILGAAPGTQTDQKNLDYLLSLVAQAKADEPVVVSSFSTQLAASLHGDFEGLLRGDTSVVPMLWDGASYTFTFESLTDDLADGRMTTPLRIERVAEPQGMLYLFRKGSEPRAVLQQYGNHSCYTYTQDRELGLVKFATVDGVHGLQFNPARRFADELVEQNGMHPSRIQVRGSIEDFYSFDGKASVNLTKSFVADWWNYATPQLRHHWIRDSREELINCSIPHFGFLINTDWYLDSTLWTVYGIEDLPDDDIKRLFLSAPHADNIFAQQARDELAKRSGTLDESELVATEAAIQTAAEKLAGYVAEHEADINRVIDEVSCKTRNALDCGFVTIMPPAPFAQKIQRVANVRSDNDRMKLPIDYQGFFDLPASVRRTQSTTAIEAALRPHMDALSARLGGGKWHLSVRLD